MFVLEKCGHIIIVYATTAHRICFWAWHCRINTDIISVTQWQYFITLHSLSRSDNDSQLSCRNIIQISGQWIRNARTAVHVNKTNFHTFEALADNVSLSVNTHSPQKYRNKVQHATLKIFLYKRLFGYSVWPATGTAGIWHSQGCDKKIQIFFLAFDWQRLWFGVPLAYI